MNPDSSAQPHENAERSKTFGRHQDPWYYIGKSCNPPPSFPDVGDTRKERLELQEVARLVLRGISAGMRFCLRTVRRDPVWNIPGVGISLGEKRACYVGLRVCGSVWSCPVCAPRISEVRRKELRRGMDEHVRRGGEVLHLVLTFPHYAGEDLGMLYRKMMTARRKMLNRKGWKRWARSVDLVGSICAKEVTFGDNGAHIHTHEILFLQKKVNLEAAEAEILQAWQSACRGAGLPPPSKKHGVRLQDGQSAADYIAKWGLERELTSWHTKKGKEGGKTPFDLLRDVKELIDLGAAADAYSSESADGFRIYVRTFKGKRQLVWSDGLRKLLLGEEEELTDQEIAAAPEDPYGSVLGVLPREAWRFVLAAGGRCRLLEIAETERSWSAVLRYVCGLGYVETRGA